MYSANNISALSAQRMLVEKHDALKVEVDRLKPLRAATAAKLDSRLLSMLESAFKGEIESEPPHNCFVR